MIKSLSCLKYDRENFKIRSVRELNRAQLFQIIYQMEQQNNALKSQLNLVDLIPQQMYNKRFVQQQNSLPSQSQQYTFKSLLTSYTSKQTNHTLLSYQNQNLQKYKTQLNHLKTSYQQLQSNNQILRQKLERLKGQVEIMEQNQKQFLYQKKIRMVGDQGDEDQGEKELAKILHHLFLKVNNTLNNK